MTLQTYLHPEQIPQQNCNLFKRPDVGIVPCHVIHHPNPGATTHHMSHTRARRRYSIHFWRDVINERLLGIGRERGLVLWGVLKVEPEAVFIVVTYYLVGFICGFVDDRFFRHFTLNSLYKYPTM